jgi:hypothetical protein
VQAEEEEEELKQKADSLAGSDPSDPSGESESDLLDLEVQQDQAGEKEIVLEGDMPDRDIPEEDDSDAHPFIHRPHLTGLFYDEIPPENVRSLLSDFAFDFRKRAAERGVELDWIDVGTWKTPDEIIPERHKEAWRLTRENYLRGNDGALNGFFKGRKVGELLGLIQEVPLRVFQSLGDRDDNPKRAMRDLASAYHDQIRSAMELYERKENTDRPEYERLKIVAEHLARVIYRWPPRSDQVEGGDSDGDE